APVCPLPRPRRELSRSARLARVVDADAALEARTGLRTWRRLAIDDHDAVDRAHLVRMRFRPDRQRRELSWMLRIAHVDDRRSVRRLHVADERRRAAHDHLTAARTIEVPDLLDPARLAHSRVP